MMIHRLGKISLKVIFDKRLMFILYNEPRKLIICKQTNLKMDKRFEQFTKEDTQQHESLGNAN